MSCALRSTQLRHRNLVNINGIVLIVPLFFVCGSAANVREHAATGTHAFQIRRKDFWHVPRVHTWFGFGSEKQMANETGVHDASTGLPVA